MLFPAAVGDCVQQQFSEILRIKTKQTQKILKHLTATILQKKVNIIPPFKMLLHLKSKDLIAEYVKICQIGILELAFVVNKKYTI